MKFIHPKFCLLLILFTGIVSGVASQEIENTLLWRISGKGMQQPSYLFGTMHSLDKKVFNFPDSLYSALDACSAFALEINPDSINSNLSEYLTKKFENYKPKSSKKLKDLLTKDEMALLEKKLGKSKADAGEMSVKQAYLLKEKLLESSAKPDDMPTFMDAFIYKIARDKGKVIEGLEPLEAQLKLLNELPDDINPKKLLQNIEKHSDGEERLIDLYLRKDLIKLQEWLQFMPDEMEESMLSKRNKVMVHNMDSIMQHQSLFSAVGAAHLPGKKGLIQLLRDSGYIVQGVTGGTNTHASKYVFKNGELPWVEVINNEAGFIVKMPGKPSDMEQMSGLVKMKMYTDITNSQGYYISAFSAPAFKDKHLRDSSIKVTSKAMITNVDGIDVKEKNIVNNGVEGREYTCMGKGKIYYRFQFLNKDENLYLLMTNSKIEKNALTDSFYASFRLLPKQRRQWVSHTFGNDFISVKMPGITRPRETVTYDADTTISQSTYTAIDESASSYFLLMISRTMEGYTYTDDSAAIEELEERIKPEVKNFEKKQITFSTFNGYEYKALQDNGTMVKGRMIFRGNRRYHLMAIYPNDNSSESIADDYLNSPLFIPLPKASYSVQTATDTAFSAYLPAMVKITTEKNVYERDSLITNYCSWDADRLISYDVAKKKLSSFYWWNNDTIVLRKWLNGFKKKDEELTSIRYNLSGNNVSAEAVGISAKTSQKHRIKVIANGTTRYTLQCTVPPFAEDDKGIDSFFNHFTILKNDTSRFKKGPEDFLAALHSTDTLLYNKAIDEKGEVYFSKDYLPLLLKEFTSEFALDSVNYYAAGSYLFNLIDNYSDTLSKDDIVSLYKKTPSNKGSHSFSVLKLLAGLKDTTAGFAALKELMLTQPPVSGYAYNLGYEILKHPKPAATLFPEFLQLTGDSISGSDICALAKEMVDSAYLSKDMIKQHLPLLLAKSALIRKTQREIEYHSMPDLLAITGSPQAFDEIRKYQFVLHNSMRYDAVKILLNNKLLPDTKILDSIASDRQYRISLYDLLKENNKSAMFPARFRTQKHFAEAALSQSAEDEEYEYVRFIMEKSTMYKDKLQKFYLYEVKYNKSDTASYLGVSGPFSNNPSVLKANEKDDATGVYFTEEFNKNKLATLLRAYFDELKENEEKYKEEE